VPFSVRVAARAAQGKLPAWQLDFLLKGSLRLEAGGRARPHAWLSALVPSRVAGCGAPVICQNVTNAHRKYRAAVPVLLRIA